jgi:hypothetical protein
MRHGQWVSTSHPFDGAHQTAARRSVGIYQAGGRDAMGDPIPEHVVIVKPDGTDLMILKDDKAVRMAFNPADLPDLKPVENADELPEPRRSHLEPGTVLNPRPAPE